jgi:hypothetical protein
MAQRAYDLLFVEHADKLDSSARIDIIRSAFNLYILWRDAMLERKVMVVVPIEVLQEYRNSVLKGAAVMGGVLKKDLEDALFQGISVTGLQE